MEFIKYNSIENTYKNDIVIKAKLLNIDEWVVTEKLHGANIGIYADNKGNTRIASRNGFTDDNFYGIGSSDECQNVIKKAASLAKTILKDNENLIAYGELVGEGVQKGVYYGKGKMIYMFSLFVNGVELPYNEQINLFEMFEILTVPFIFKGSFNDSLEISNQFKSLVATDYEGDNICEGVVIKPFTPVKFHTGSSVIFKNKNEKFKEKESAKKEYVKHEINQVFFDTFIPYVNENMAQSVVSKTGKDMSLMPQYMKEFTDEMMREVSEIDFLSDEYKNDRKVIIGEFIKLVKGEVLR